MLLHSQLKECNVVIDDDRTANHAVVLKLDYVDLTVPAFLRETLQLNRAYQILNRSNLRARMRWCAQ